MKLNDLFTDVPVEVLKEFYNWRIENRWFTRSRGKWNYTFEQGTHISEESYNKNYRKTTSELFILFICQKQMMNSSRLP